MKYTGKAFPWSRETNGGALKFESAQYQEKIQMETPIAEPKARARKIGRSAKD